MSIEPAMAQMQRDEAMEQAVRQYAMARRQEPSLQAQEHAFAPPAGRTLVFIGQDRDTINEYVKATNLPPAGVMVYTSIQHLQGLTQPTDYGAGVQSAQELATTYPQATVQLGLWMVGGLHDVTNGAYDENIDRLAAWIKKADRPVYLRIGYEFDLPLNHYDPVAYVPAYRYLVERLRSQGAANAAFVWHSYAGDREIDISQWYPGDAYVDWCAISAFDQDPAEWEPMATFAKAHGKPLMIAEATPKGLGTKNVANWQDWLTKMTRYIKQHDARAFCYINTNWEAQKMWDGQGWEDARVQANLEVQDAWLAAMRTPRYLHAAPELFSSLGYTPKHAKAASKKGVLNSLLPYQWR